MDYMEKIRARFSQKPRTADPKEAIVQSLVDLELGERGLFFNSDHEGFAVILEQFEETEETMAECAVLLDKLWTGVKSGNLEPNVLERLEMTSAQMLDKAVQVAVAVKKFKVNHPMPKDKT